MSIETEGCLFPAHWQTSHASGLGLEGTNENYNFKFVCLVMWHDSPKLCLPGILKHNLDNKLIEILFMSAYNYSVCKNMIFVFTIPITTK